MNDAIGIWLRDTFAGISDVRRATTQPDSRVIFQNHKAHVVVSTWMGARLYIYVLEKPPKVRDLKNILRDNSRNGIGTLFVMQLSELPKHDDTLRLTDWQEALMLLNDDFIYAYAVKDGEISLTQVHFSASSTKKDDYRIWYLRNFQIENVSVRKRDIGGNIKGAWRLGDIASPAYKRRMNHERVHQRFHYRTQYTQEIPNARANGSHPRKRSEQLAYYYQLLGVDKDAKETDIKAAFRRIALQVHPDVSALPRQEAHRRIKELNEAYEFIKDFHGWA
ncbi:MAG: DnaJ domain-containing protein [Anaerolineae bacterium]|nr:DnaJ domain-containing protein [Anaerolineae bacterium]MDQ7036258.1 DnaJ domain-containing protein [Anaerolineae bacterium]